ncbi:bifunctional Serine hydroxymethyltransferase/Pyridoxal phosphate-dependent transferase [Babesia duncani]|uniref:Serine hydroxymethyltransferase n=1 Tax=Babesia duncani TaxID=323732 RepID=A0AAD9UPR8_9APIC|nr:bifunctional Serine hydroxymethyltransferase/Pyridoxal phosphate-dependent transferase [Babesia duncani]
MASNTASPLNDSLPLKEADPVMYEILQQEIRRQEDSIDLIASENTTSRAVMEIVGSQMTNKYAEGYPGRRYYGGCDVIDEAEKLCIKRALEAFKLDSNEWGVNVQALSGSPANLAVYVALLQPHDKILGMALSAGGHLTHGFYNCQKKISASTIFFSSLQYGLDPETGLIDYDQLEKLAKLYYPQIIIAGASCYSRYIDYARFRKIADSVGAYLMADIAHIAGLIAAGLHPSPFEYCDVVTTTTHKTLKGPRAALIFYNRKIENIEERINTAVFPTLQGGPHMNAICGIAVQLNQVLKPEWRVYMQAVVDNARALAKSLQDLGFDIVTGGTDNHTVIVNLRNFGITGSKAEMVANHVGYTLNKSTVPGDVSALNPSGLRLGTAAVSARGMKPEHMEFLAKVLHEIVQICIELQSKFGKKLVDFKKGLDDNQALVVLKEKVTTFARQFPT